MTEYIEREAALNASKIVYIEYIEIDGDGYEDGNADEIPVVFRRDIEAIPAADVVTRDCYNRLLAENDELRKERPVRHGRWLSMDGDNITVSLDEYGCPTDSCRCSECGDWLTASDEYSVRGRYCANCGARMDKDGGGE